MRLTNTDLTPFIELHNEIVREFFEEIKKREEQHRMTITAEEIAAEVATPDTPSGTIVRLRDEHVNEVYAEAGALAFVGPNSGLYGPPCLDIRWFKGVAGEYGIVADGGWWAHRFEIFEFQVDDRVRVVDSIFAWENGEEGTIVSVPAPSGEDCIVSFDRGDDEGGLTFNFSALEKIDALSASDEALQALREKLSTPEPKRSTNEDIRVLAVREGSMSKGFCDQWNGLRFPLTEDNWLIDGVFDKRPDGIDGNFRWDDEDRRGFDPELDLRVGDIVESSYYAQVWQVDIVRGVVISLGGTLGGDIVIDWTEGPERLTTIHPIGAESKYLELMGTTDIRPRREDWGFEAGQEIGSSDVLEDLPTGTVVIIANDPESPIIKLGHGNFGRLNRWSNAARNESPMAFYEDRDVKRAADGVNGDALLIAYVPA